jgi:hypothetical protein
MKQLFTIFRDGDAGGASGAGGAAPAQPAAAPPASLAAAAAARADASADGAPASAAPADASGQPPAAPNGAYFPEGLPEQFRGASERETIDKLAQEIAGRPKPPASPKDYKFELSPDMKAKFGELKDDKVLPLWGEVAHELGLDDQRATAAFEKLYQKMDKAGLVDHGPDYEAELKKLMPNSGNERERNMAAKQRIDGAMAFVQGLETNGTLAKEEAARLHALVDDAVGVQIMEKLQRAMRGTGLVNGGAPAQPYSDADWRRDMSDPRYSTTSPQHDPEFRKSVDEKAARLPRKKIMADGTVG